MTRTVTVNPKKWIVHDEILAARCATARDSLAALLGGTADLTVLAIQELEELIAALDDDAEIRRKMLEGRPLKMGPAGAAPSSPTPPATRDGGGMFGHAVQ